MQLRPIPGKTGNKVKRNAMSPCKQGWCRYPWPMDLSALISLSQISLGQISPGPESAPPWMAAWPVDGARLGSFVVLTTGFAVAPGPAVLFAIATGMAHGPRAGLSGIAGISIASTIWFIGAALGLGTQIKAWPLAFRVMAWLGVIYIFWLGARALLSAWKGEGDASGARPAGRGIAFRDGLMVQLFNPKALLFFVVILPPFIDPRAPTTGQMAVLGAVAIGIDFMVLSAYALAGGALGAQLHNRAFRRGFMALVGLLLIGSGLMVATRIQG